MGGPPSTIVDAIAAAASTRPTDAAVYGKVGPQWRRLSWALYASSVRQAAKGLIELGLAPGEVVAVVTTARPDWSVAQGGIVTAGAVIAPIAADAPLEALQRRLAALAPRIVVCDDVPRLATLRAVVDAGGLPVHAFVILDAVTAHDPRMRTLDDLMIDGATVRDGGLDARIAGLGPDTVAVRQVGEQGGIVDVRHRDLLDRAQRIVARAFGRTPPREGRLLADAPPDDLAAQVVAWALPAATGWEAWYRPPEGAFADALGEVRPTIALGTASAWDTVAAAARRRLGSEAGVRSGLASWAATRERSAVFEGRDGLGRRLARRLVLDAVRRDLGVDGLALALATGRPSGEADLASVGVVLEREAPP